MILLKISAIIVAKFFLKTLKKILTILSKYVVIDLRKNYLQKLKTMKKITVIFVAIAVVITLFVVSYKIAVAVLLLAMFCAGIGVLVLISAKNWEELEKEDPRKARELWFLAMQELDRSRYGIA